MPTAYALLLRFGPLLLILLAAGLAIALGIQDYLSVDGEIATNTTIGRPVVEGARNWNQTGGLSGAPLMAKSTAVLRMLRTRLPESIPMIGVGGILDGADAVTKTAAGATLVQLYSGLVYRGPALIGECVEAMRRRRYAPSSRPAHE